MGGEWSLITASKHEDNLVQIKHCLDTLGIRSHIGRLRHGLCLRIHDCPSKEKFGRFVGFRIKKKKAKLEKLPRAKTCYCNREIYEKAIGLREKELSYRKIARKLRVR